MKQSLLALVLLFTLLSPCFAQDPDTIANNIYECNGRLGIGTQYPGSSFQIVADQQIVYPSEGIFSLKNNHYASVNGYTFNDQYFVGSMFNGTRSRGTINNPLNVQDGDRITGLISAIFYDNDYHTNGAISIYTGKGVSYGSYPSYIVFNTTATGSDYYSERMRISEEGYLGIGTQNPAAKVQIAEGDVYISDINYGIIMKSPDGNCWRGLLDNMGHLDFSQCDCPHADTDTIPPSANDPQGENTSVYPNPAGNSTTIEILDPDVSEATYTIHDMKGKVKVRGSITGRSKKVDISMLEPGMYAIQIVDPEGNILSSKKFVKN
ncbi:MAG TPA: T9SS type A sorting domain-containing protein [Lentimicrobium sp.]|nr:T9SS type A sorting domain-containing protein [Lentimicrobium sp.]